MNSFGLIGFPLEHSFSKKYFTEKFEEENLDCNYQAYPLKSLELFPVLLRNPDLKGLNVTIPYKKDILCYLDDVSNIPLGLNACNCIKIVNGRTMGYNTDVIGFEQSLTTVLKPYHKKALILGNGGSAQAVKYVLKKLNLPYELVSRKIHDDSSLTYTDLNEKIISSSQLIINTTPLGMYPQSGTFPLIPYEAISEHHLLFDLVYNPATTLFLQKGAARGAAIRNGYEMLIIQAEESWKIWNEQ